MRPARAAAALALAACGGPAAPDVVLVTLDTVRADRLGCYGGRAGVSPSIDALAARGALFEDAWTPRGQTWPALATLLSGREPLAHGVRENGFALPATVPTLAEILRARGWRTGAFLTNACEEWGDARFDRLECARGAGEELGDQSRLQAEWDRRAVGRALEWLAASDAPSFAWVHLYDAHKPWPTADALRERHLDPAYAGPFRPAPGEASEAHAMPLHDRVDAAALAGRAPEGADLEALLALYDAGITSTDGAVAELAAGLARLGRLDGAYLVLTADHGEELFDHACYPYHGAGLHGSTLRVPLLIAGPGIAALRIADPVGLADVMPTLAELLDLPLPGDLGGTSLVPLFSGQPIAERPFVSELVEYDMGAAAPSILHDVFAIRRGRWRLLWNPDHLDFHKEPFGSLVGPGVLHPTALYDLATDPAESRDVSCEHPDLILDLSAELATHVGALRAMTPLALPPSAELVSSLRALGYFDAR